MMYSFALLSSMIAIVVSQRWNGQGPQAWNGKADGPYTFGAMIPSIEKMDFGTTDDIQTYRCNIAGCLWSEAIVHEDWMFYGAGVGNKEAWEPLACAERCAQDVECGSFEFDVTRTGVQYCSWWKVGACDQPKTKNAPGESFHTCAKKPHPCPFMAKTTANVDELQCKDGSTCTFEWSAPVVDENGNTKVDVTNADCCDEQGGRAFCPANYPVMCESTACAGDYCCEASVAECWRLYSTGARIANDDGIPCINPVKCTKENNFICPKNMYCDFSSAGESGIESGMGFGMESGMPPGICKGY